MKRAPLALTPLLAVLLPALAVRAAEPMPADFQPDPRSVQRHGAGYRYPQAGWIVLHIEGEPYERGYQHGKLLAPEIAGYVRCFAAIQSPKAPTEGWKLTRSLTNAVFLRRYAREYLEEMKGIADGAAAGGARFDDRPLDVVDIAAINVWPEIETLDSALSATPTGLEGMRFPDAAPKVMPKPKADHCSAFAATGPATADGKIVFGHITMFSLYPSNFFNVWLDVKPAKGHRVMMQSFPGGIQSGMDYYINDAGLLVSETTIHQTRFDVSGLCLASRIRQALQYADSIDKAVALLEKDNNGLYTNEWLLADIKTNEIAMFELGTHKSKLWRSSKNEWVGGTEGFYWGCNNTKDLNVRLETVASSDDRPANVVFRSSDRDKVWLKLYAQYKGKIDADFARLAFTTPPLAAYHSLDAKFTTTALAKDLKTWALFGPPLGRSWQPTNEERHRYSEIQPLVSNPWTILHTTPPAKSETPGPVAVDLQEERKHSEDKTDVADADADDDDDDSPVATRPAWHGTLLPKTDADVWLAAAFADYERIVSLELALRDRAKENKLTSADRERLAAALFGHRAAYFAGARAMADVPLLKTHADLTGDEWYRVASGKGVLLLNELRHLLGDAAFLEMMDSFGRAHAGKQVTSAEFRAHVEKTAGQALDGFFDYWLQQPGLPLLKLGKVTVSSKGAGFEVHGEILREGRCPGSSMLLLVKTTKGTTTKLVTLTGSVTTFAIETDDRPQRLLVDPYGQSAMANGGPYATSTFNAELEHTLIVYGTADETPSNREAAEALQRAIVQRWSNFTVPIKADKDVTEEELKTHHLLLIGRPDSNGLVGRVRSALPLSWGSRSFEVNDEVYAHPDSAVIAAGASPFNRRYSVVVVAGLSAASTLRTAPLVLQRGGSSGEVVVLGHGKKARALVVPPRELIQDFKEP